MSNVKFNHSNAEGHQTVSVFITKDDGTSVNKIVTPANASFQHLVTYLVTTPEDEYDVEHVHGLVDPSVGVGRMLQEEFGDRVTFDQRHFYLDGIPETSLVADHAKQQVMGGKPDWKRLVRFLVRLGENPSKKAKDAIWLWVEKHGVTITEDGRMVGYKGLVNGTDAVTGEYGIPVSYHSGPNNFIDGSLYGEAGTAYQVPHRLGAVISKRRADVDDNTKMACSTGLHVGAYSYAKTFGENREDGRRYSTMGKMASTFALVAFAPEDVVSVPEDGTADWKIRVAKYEVVEFLSEVKDVLKDTPVYDVKTPAPFLPKGEEFQAEPTVEKVEEPVAVEEDLVDDYGMVVEPVVEDADNGVEWEADPEVTDGVNAVLVEPEKGTGLLGRIVLQDWADLNPGLAADLADTSQGHKALGRKYEAITSEASVRRYRKSHGI